MKSLWFILLAGILALMAGCGSPTATPEPLIVDVQFEYQPHAGAGGGYDWHAWMDISRNCNYTEQYWFNHDPDTDPPDYSWSDNSSDHLRLESNGYACVPAGSPWTARWTAGNEDRELTGIFQ